MQLSLGAVLSRRRKARESKTPGHRERRTYAVRLLFTAGVPSGFELKRGTICFEGRGGNPMKIKLIDPLSWADFG
jgi:hypothetical protein